MRDIIVNVLTIILLALSHAQMHSSKKILIRKGFLKDTKKMIFIASCLEAVSGALIVFVTTVLISNVMKLVM